MKLRNRSTLKLAATFLIATGLAGCGASEQAAQSVPAPVAADAVGDISDAALVRTLPGFEEGYGPANGARLHYVAGGSGEALILLPGWPQTWWEFHKVMPALAAKYRVIAVDLRGMGASDRPAGGYDKKTMARDILDLLQHLKIERAHIVGHDIGAQVAFAFAANHPAATRTLTLLDVPHPDEALMSWPLLPAANTFGDKLDPANIFPWWFAFYQVKGLPEDLLEGRVQILQAWFFRYLLKDESAIDARDRAVYAKAYESRDAIRAGNAWYQAFPQDILDDKTYSRLQMPVLGLAGPGYAWLKSTLERKAVRPIVIELPESGHFLAEEAPEATTRHLLEFLDGK